VKQAGSLVAPEHLRFDFNHHEQIPADQLARIERRVNEWIMSNDAVTTYEMALKDVPGSGIVAVFDEKYGDTVRVVDIGGYSRELCGGTHAAATGDLGFFRIVSEGSIASGVRRIEALCGTPAYEAARREHDLVSQLLQRFSATPDELPGRIENLLKQNRQLEKQLKEQAMSAAAGQVDDLAGKARDVDGVTVSAEDVGEQDMEVLRGMMDKLRGAVQSGVLVLGSQSDGKACFTAVVSDDLVRRGLHAGKLIGQVAKAAGGGGGGQPARAQAGGKDGSKVPEALGLVEEAVRSMLKT
jgi:alanyl-tRNA synthetase